MKRILSTLSHKWPEYLLEIIVITIGILGAFALNNWNEQLKAIKQEQVLLKQLKIEYEANLKQLKSKIATRNALSESSKELLGYFDYPETATMEEVLPRLSKLGLTVTFDPIQNDLFASGNINRISNPQLKALLTRWSTDVIQVTEVEALYLREYYDHTTPLLARLGVGRESNFHFWQSIQELDYMLEKNEMSTFDYGSSHFLPPVGELLNSAELEAYIARSILFSDFINLESRTLQHQIEEILKLLNEEINE
jgi:hypothetical protein